MRYWEILEKIKDLGVLPSDKIESINIDDFDNEIAAILSDDDNDRSYAGWSIYSYRRWPDADARDLERIHAALPPLPVLQTVGEIYENMNARLSKS